MVTTSSCSANVAQLGLARGVTVIVEGISSAAATVPCSCGQEMRDWYHGWDPLSFVTETRIDAFPAVTDIVESIYTDITQ
jgi:hypothetical protein